MRRNGYRYVLQTDDDSFLMEPILINLVTLLEKGNFGMAAREVREDNPAVMWGLAEVAKYFMVTELIAPSTLFNHCRPHDITGVYSR